VDASIANLTPVIETMEHRWMRAWVNDDMRALKAITAKSFILLTASKPPAILDRPSWLDAAAKRYLCSSYRFGDIYVQEVGGLAVFAAPVDLKATMDGRDWSGTLFVTDIWRKGRVRRGWKLAQRILSTPDERPELAKAIKSLQLWK
jgi:ketosteroid isomerase-like protein